MFKFHKIALLVFGFLFALPLLAAPISQSAQRKISPEKVIRILKAGNRRFVQNTRRRPDIAKRMRVTSKKGQFPYALIFSCIDSRSIPELVFDQSIGDIFTARIAGNVASTNVIASMEFATKYAGSKVIVVMGHTKCGAMHAACTGKVEGALKSLITSIRPAVVSSELKLKNKNCADPKLINEIAKQNVNEQIKIILTKSKIIRDLVKDHKIIIVGALHNISTGKVVFFKPATLT